MDRGREILKGKNGWMPLAGSYNLTKQCDWNSIIPKTTPHYPPFSKFLHATHRRIVYSGWLLVTVKRKCKKGVLFSGNRMNEVPGDRPVDGLGNERDKSSIAATVFDAGQFTSMLINSPELVTRLQHMLERGKEVWTLGRGLHLVLALIRVILGVDYVRSTWTWHRLDEGTSIDG